MVVFVPVLWNSSWLVFSRKVDVSIRLLLLLLLILLLLMLWLWLLLLLLLQLLWLLLLLLLLLLLFMAEVVQLEPSVEAGVLRCTPSWFLVGRVWTDDVT